MNKPKKRRRYQKPKTPPRVWDGTFTYGLNSKEYASELADVVTQFEHLETMMVKVFASLLGSPTDEPAGYVYRTIRSPGQRAQIMRTLLEKAPDNHKRGEMYDEILDEYDALRTGRNLYVHGLWYEHEESGKVYLSKVGEFEVAFEEAKIEPLENLRALRMRISALLVRVIDEVEVERRRRDSRLRKRKKAALEKRKIV